MFSIEKDQYSVTIVTKYLSCSSLKCYERLWVVGALQYSVVRHKCSTVRQSTVSQSTVSQSTVSQKNEPTLAPIGTGHSLYRFIFAMVLVADLPPSQ